jgi:DNA-binding NarL/FixJ family response regulator
MTSTRDAEDVVERARECGARGFVPKDDLSAAALGALLE